MEFNTLKSKWGFVDMYLFLAIFWFINPTATPMVLGIVIGMTLGALFIDIAIYIYEKIKRENKKC